MELSTGIRLLFTETQKNTNIELIETSRTKIVYSLLKRTGKMYTPLIGIGF